MAYHSFERLEVWKRATALSIKLIPVLNTCRDYAFKNQMMRAMLSIPSNIAEGAERQTDKEFKYFLNVAKGSSAELRTQLFIAKESKIFEQAFCQECIDECKELSSMLQGLIKSIDQRHKS